MSKLIPKYQKGNYMQTSTGKVANFQLPEVEVTAKSPTGDAWKDRNLYKAYKGRRYISEGRQSVAPLIQSTASLSPIGDITDAIEIGRNINKSNYGQAALGAGLFLLPNILEKPIKKLIPRKVLKELSLEDVKSWTDKDWDANYNQAIKEGNNDRVQRIRDLHFKVKAPNTKIVNDDGSLKTVYHGGDAGINIFKNRRDINPKITHSSRFNNKNTMGIYFTDNKKVADEYTLSYKNTKRPYNIYNAYLNLSNVQPIKQTQFYGLQWLKNINKLFNKDYINYQDIKVRDVEKLNAKNIDGLKTKTWDNSNEYVFFDSNKVKSAEPITYDDSGNIIPISKRDNFNSPDIRYGLIPLAGFGAYKQYNKENE